MIPARYRGYLVPASTILLAVLLFWWILSWAPPRVSIEPPAPTQTPWVIVITSTPPSIPAGPATTRTPTPTWTPRPERLPLREMTPTTRVPTGTATSTPEPTNTRVPAPSRPMEQKG